MLPSLVLAFLAARSRLAGSVHCRMWHPGDGDEPLEPMRERDRGLVRRRNPGDLRVQPTFDAIAAATTVLDPARQH
jgi:hypothetical protein